MNVKDRTEMHTSSHLKKSEKKRMSLNNHHNYVPNLQDCEDSSQNQGEYVLDCIIQVARRQIHDSGTAILLLLKYMRTSQQQAYLASFSPSAAHSVETGDKPGRYSSTKHAPPETGKLNTSPG